MTTDTKKLAEFAAEFLGGEKVTDTSWYLLPKGSLLHPDHSPTASIDLLTYWLFEDKYNAPILAHLAKREMEKRGLTWELGSHDGVGYSCKISDHYKSTGRYVQLSFVSQQPNEYIALWSAIMEATGEK